MAKGKREMPRNYKGRTAVIALALIFCCTVGGTLAWLVATTGSVTNTFTPAQVECSVNDSYVNHQKTDVKVTNPNGVKNVDAYVRVTFVATWETEDENHTAVAKDTSTFELPDDSQLNTNWFKGSDGYYYYKNKLAVGSITEPVFTTAIKVPTDDDYEMNVQVLAEAIQADGKSGSTPVVQNVWAAVQVNSDGTLSAKNS